MYDFKIKGVAFILKNCSCISSRLYLEQNVVMKGAGQIICEANMNIHQFTWCRTSEYQLHKKYHVTKDYKS
jgi:hypothetical protein